MVNNYDWTASLSTIDFLRDIGKHFPVNRMLARDVVKSRLEAGISYTEFSYVLLQSMDFLNLYRDHGVTLQFGGSDQWGNLTGGVELIRRADGGKAHAFATPLVTKADGTKYGKTEGGALWLDPEMMSPYAFYQFWLNVEDEKVGELLRIFTFLSRDGDRGPRGADAPRSRSCGPGRRRWPTQVTTLVHGAEETERDQGRGRGPVRRRRPARAERRRRSAPRCARPASTRATRRARRRRRPAGRRPGWPRARARPGAPINEGGAYLNNERVRTPTSSRATPTCSAAAGWCCAAARSTSPASSSSELVGGSERGPDLRERIMWPAPHGADLTAVGARPSVLSRRHGAAGRKAGRSGGRPEAKPPKRSPLPR